MSGKISAESSFRADINGLRALSVALVVLFHVKVPGAGGGFIGVDVFFVISGYLMTRIIDGGVAAGTFAYWRFIAARATRIWPALGAMVLAALVVGAFLLPPADLHQLARQAGPALAFWSNHYFRDHSGYDTDAADGNWLLHTWSLAVEWQFYVLYPLLLATIARWARRSPEGAARRAAAAWLVAALAAASLAKYVVDSGARPSDAFFLLPSRAWQMAAGGLVYFAERRVSPGRWRSVASVAGVGLIVLAALWFDLLHVSSVGLGWRSVVPVAGAMLVLWADDGRNVLLANAWAQRIGLASYSIYLWHWPLVVAAEVADLEHEHRLAARVGLVVASVVLGELSYRFVELRWTRRPAAPPVRFASRLGPAGLLAAAGAAALVATTTRGLDFRMRGVSAAEIAPATESDYFPARCSNFRKRVDELTVCTIEKDDRRRVLVIGDSHAEHLYPWFASKSQVSVDFFTQAECPPVPNFERLEMGFHCLDYARKAWDMAASAAYDTVILSARWPLIGELGPPFCRREPSGACTPLPDQRERQAAARDELRAAILSILARGETVVVLDSTPETPVQVPQRLERERYWYGAPRFTIDRASLGVDAWIDQLWTELEPIPGYHHVSLRPVLCDATTCRVWDEAIGRSIYVDGGHLAPAWTVQHGDVFAPFVQLQRAP
jgi:peptidoglycan/LPS O-acetylase OafA/YrhL